MTFIGSRLIVEGVGPIASFNPGRLPRFVAVSLGANMNYNFDDGTAIQRVLDASEQSFSDDTMDAHIKEAQEAVTGKAGFDSNVALYGRDWLIGFLAFVYAFGMTFRSTWKQSKKLLHAWSIRQIKKPKASANVWYPTLVLLTGHFSTTDEQVEVGEKGKKKTKQTKFHRHESLPRYAGTLAYMEQQGVPISDAVQYLTEHTPSGLLKKYQDGLDKSKKRKTFSNDDLALVDKITRLGSISLKAKPVEAGETDFVEAICVWENDQVRIVGFLKDSGSRARNRAIALAKEQAENAETDAEVDEFFEANKTTVA
uniref:Uncharacterized protein n=1 Tax=Caulobacter sp. (strain K31) TaxID=366602 RepID=B0T651_CAUSK